MNPLVHVLISLLIGLALTIHSAKRYWIVLGGAFLINGFIDSDYLLIRYGLVGERIFQTGIVMVYAPLMILAVVHAYERKKGTSILTRISLMTVVIAFSHLFLDTINREEPVFLYYPITKTEFALNADLIPFTILLFGLMIVTANMIETFLYSLNEGAQGLKQDQDMNRLTRDYSSRMNDILRKLKG